MYRINSRQLVVVLLYCVCASGNARCDEIVVESVMLRLLDEVEVPARAVGALSTINVREGDKVSKGFLLAQIDDTEAKLELDHAELDKEIALRESLDDVAIRSAAESLTYAENQHRRLSIARNSIKGSVSESELEKARMDAQQAELEVERGKKDLEKAKIQLDLVATKLLLAQRNVDVRKILAPQSGIVLEVMHQVGEWVTPGDTVVRVVNTEKLRVDGFVAASKVRGDLKGEPVKVRPKNLETEFSGQIVFVSPEVDVDGKVRVVAEIKNKDGLLRPGQRADMILNRDDI